MGGRVWECGISNIWSLRPSCSCRSLTRENEEQERPGLRKGVVTLTVELRRRRSAMRQLCCRPTTDIKQRRDRLIVCFWVDMDKNKKGTGVRTANSAAEPGEGPN